MSEDHVARAAAEGRVRAFMTEFDAQWRIAAPAFEERDPEDPGRAFALWGELMAQTVAAHFTAPSTVDLARSFSGEPEYGPDAERFVRSELDGDTAYVLTQETMPLARLREYTLREQEGEWRIAAIAMHADEPAEPFVDRAVIDERIAQCGPSVPLGEMPPEQASLDENRMFTDRSVPRPRGGETAQAQVTPIGTLVTTTGVLSVLDFGYRNHDARPLARTVRPGSYPVDRVMAFGRNAAVRVRFGDAEPVAWHPASLPGSGHVVGVDAGSVCIVDHVAYAGGMTRRAKEAAWARFTADTDRPTAMEVPLGGEDVGVAVDSGYGDGSYPAYWGVDAHGEPAQLVVDFMVLVDQDDEGMLTTL